MFYFIHSAQYQVNALKASFPPAFFPNTTPIFFKKKNRFKVHGGWEPHVTLCYYRFILWLLRPLWPATPSVCGNLPPFLPADITHTTWHLKEGFVDECFVERSVLTCTQPSREAGRYHTPIFLPCSICNFCSASTHVIMIKSLRCTTSGFSIRDTFQVVLFPSSVCSEDLKYYPAVIFPCKVTSRS